MDDDPIAPSLNEKIKNAISNFPKSLSVCHLNAQSLVSSIDEIRTSLHGNPIHVIGVSETWLHESISLSLVELGGYTLIRNDRKSGRGGGVGFYIRSDLRPRVVLSSSDGIIEYLFIELDFSGSSILLGVVYRPPAPHSDILDLDQVLGSISTRCHHSIIMGDFNINLLAPTNACVRKLTSLTTSHQFTILPSDPTHFPPHSTPSLLDLCWVLHPSRVCAFKQLDAPGISAHSFLLCSYDIRHPKPKAKWIETRSLTRVSRESLLIRASAVPWDKVFCHSEPNEMMTVFNQFLLEILDEFAPKRYIKIREGGSRWFNGAIADSIKARDRAYARWRKSDTHEHYEIFRSLRNKTKAMVRSAKRRLIMADLNPELTPRQLWNNLKKHGFVQSTSKSCPFDLNDLNRHFTSSDVGISTPPICLEETLSNGFYFSCISVDEVLNAISGLKPGAPGSDGISLAFLRLILPVILPVLTNIFNRLITSSCFPNCWKSAKITPIPKTNRPGSPSDYRPISVLPVISKVFEKILYSQILGHIEQMHLLIPFQSGFRPGHSCATALLKVTDDCRAIIEEYGSAILVLLDFKNAFGSVDHSILVRKLHDLMGLSGAACRMIFSYLSGRSQWVELDGVTSSSRDLLRGVPQGGVLSPLLFSLFINDLPRVLRHCSYHLFADDLQIYSHLKRADMMLSIAKVNTDIESIAQWSALNGLKLNPVKTQAIVISSRDQGLVPLVNVCGTDIPYSAHVRDLGIVINSRLTWGDHVGLICKRVYGSLYPLRRMASATPLWLRRRLVLALIMPHFLNGEVVYFGLDRVSLQRLVVAFNSCIRYIYDLGHRDHVSERVVEVLGVTMPNYLKIRYLRFIHKVLRSGSPAYLADLLTTGPSPRARSLICPRHLTALRSKSFAVTAPRLWNSMPSALRQHSTTARFLTGLTEFVSSPSTGSSL